jgi:DNA helicase-2/ATP-dependent DNA helicase PcrA
LDHEQLAVAQSQGSPLAVVAGPGTGKTRALTARIAHGAATGALDPEATLAVTFTTRAAAELRSRLAGMGVAGVRARTFHSAALAQAQFFWPLAFGVKLPQVLDSSAQLVRQVMPGFALEGRGLERDLAQEIAWTKQSNVTPERYQAAARAAGRRLPGLEPNRVAEVIVEYERLKQTLGLIDLDDILLCAAAVLNESEEAARQMARRYHHLLVDEFQDVSPIQWRLVELWRGRGRDICVVGDPAQAIHGYAGARSEYLEAFARRLGRGAAQLGLSRDYRSTPQIVALANAVMAGHGAVELRSQRPDGPAVVWDSAASEEQEAAAAAAWLAQLGAAGLPLSEMALLYRGHAQAAGLVQALRRLSLPHRLIQPGGALESEAGPTAGPPAITCCSLHAAKGCEWEAVALVGAGEGRLPHPRATTPEALAEERRLLYVGLTRARQHLRVSWSPCRRGGPGRPSRFLGPAGIA